MNKTAQFLNKSVCLSICVHVIAVAIAALSIVGTVDKQDDAIVGEFISHAHIKPIREPRRIRMPALVQPAVVHSQPQRIQTPLDIARIPESTTRFAVETLPISSAQQAAPPVIGTVSEKSLQRSISPAPLDRGSQPIRPGPKRIPRPAGTATLSVTASAYAAELPSVEVLPDEPPIQDAKFFRKVDPIYPESARLSHKEGLVVLEATIGTDGIARNIRVVKVVALSGLGCEAAAITALKASRFVPAKRGKVVISQRLRLSLIHI